MTQSRTQCHLSSNLQALAEVNPELAERLSWPVALEHLAERADGRSVYRIRQEEHLLDEDPQTLSERIQGAKTAPNPPLVFGIGTGQVVTGLLRDTPSNPIVAWDRDPAVMRLALSREDWTAPLRNGHLQLHLNADLLRLRPAIASYHRMDHPFLGSLMARSLFTNRRP